MPSLSLLVDPFIVHTKFGFLLVELARRVLPTISILQAPHIFLNGFPPASPIGFSAFLKDLTFDGGQNAILPIRYVFISPSEEKTTISPPLDLPTHCLDGAKLHECGIIQLLSSTTIN